MNALDEFYLKLEEPTKSCLLALREIILTHHADITHAMKYGMPFFCYRGKMFCYMWYHKKHQQPYLGIVEGNRFTESFLIQEKRSRMKIMLLDPNKDLPVRKINALLKKMLGLYRSGTIPITH